MSNQKHIELSSSVPYEDIKVNINAQQQHQQQQQQILAPVLPHGQTIIEVGKSSLEIMKEEKKQAYTYLLAGAAAGVMEHCIMYPVDSVKTRMQSLRPHPKAVYRSVHHALKKMIRSEGLMRPVRGINIVAIGAAPSHALYFSSYEMTKKLLGKKGVGAQSALVNAAAGSVATVFHDGVMNPVDAIKQRLQMYGSPYRGVYDCARTIFKNEGYRAFYRSFTTQLTMNIPFQCIHFVTYEFLRVLFNPEGGYNPSSHLWAGAMAGGLAAALTTPLDVAKTLLNTQEEGVVRDSTKKAKITSNNGTFVRGMINALVTIYRVRGIPGYFQGIRARIIYQAPSCAISWSVYEFFKHYLSLRITEEEILELSV